MKRLLFLFIPVLLVCGVATDADGRGFGGGGSFGGGRSFGGGFSTGDYRSGDFRSGGSFDSAYRTGDYSGSHSFDTYSGDRGGFGATSSYDRSYTGSRGVDYSASGERGVGVSPWGGAAAGGTRDVSATGPDGRTYSSSREGGAVSSPFGGVAAGGNRDVNATGIDGRSYSSSRDAGFAAGPYGRTVGGATRSTSATGINGSYNGHMSTDFGLSHYSSFNTTTAHSTAYWSHSTMTNQATVVRTNFGYYNAFRPNWYVGHPGAWVAAGWDAGVAWTAAPWATLAATYAFTSPPIYYDYGNTIVYQDDNVYQDGQQIATADQYAQQATNLADQGQKAAPPPQQQWTPLGVFALVSGTEKTSNNLFQLAINSDGIVRGNYYDGLMDTTTPVYGSLDKKTQRLAWTIGKKNDRIFDTGLDNLTKSEAPILVHFGATRTVQMLLVRVEQQPGNGAN